MKLSTKARYGVRLMLDLAEHGGGSPVILKDIASRQGISEKYLWQLIPSLKAADLILSTRGANGGYFLRRPPAKINMKEVVIALEGSLCMVECVDNPGVCDQADFCVSRDLWGDMAAVMLHMLEETTLADLLKRKEAKARTGLTYNI